MSRAPSTALVGTTVVTGWGGCLAALGDPRLSSDPRAADPSGPPATNLLAMDGEGHQALRRLVAPRFGPAAVERLHAPMAELRDRLVSGLAHRPGTDLVAELAEPLVLASLFDATEVPAGNRPRLTELLREMVGLLEPDQQSGARRRAERAALRATLLFERDAARGRATGLHRSLEDAAARGEITTKQARATPVVVLHGGYENPLNQLSCLIAWAASDPHRFRVAAAVDADRLFDEVLRTHTPARRVLRWTTTADGDTAGATTWVDLESANLDPARLSRPDEVDVMQRRRHLGFGHGRHACVGAPLARCQGRLVVDALLSLPPQLLATADVAWHEGTVARGAAHVRISGT